MMLVPVTYKAPLQATTAGLVTAIFRDGIKLQELVSGSYLNKHKLLC